MPDMYGRLEDGFTLHCRVASGYDPRDPYKHFQVSKISHRGVYENYYTIEYEYTPDQMDHFRYHFRTDQMGIPFAEIAFDQHGQMVVNLREHSRMMYYTFADGGRFLRTDKESGVTTMHRPKFGLFVPDTDTVDQYGNFTLWRIFDAPAPPLNMINQVPQPAGLGYLTKDRDGLGFKLKIMHMDIIPNVLHTRQFFLGAFLTFMNLGD